MHLRPGHGVCKALVKVHTALSQDIGLKSEFLTEVYQVFGFLVGMDNILEDVLKLCGVDPVFAYVVLEAL